MTINAKEARETTKTAIINSIDYSIRTAASNGQINIITSCYPKNCEKDFLIETYRTLGYTVTEYKSDHSFWLDITW